MRNTLAVTLAVLLLAWPDSSVESADSPERTMPHQAKCAVPLPKDFWDGEAARDFQEAEAWAWEERICMGLWADMRSAPGGSGDAEECEPAEIENKGKAVPANRRLRPKFLELILSHQPWASAQRHPLVGIRCGLVRGGVHLDGHEISVGFSFHRGKIEGRVSLLGTKFKRGLSLERSTVTGQLDADRLELGGNLVMSGGTFAGVNLIAATIGSNLQLSVASFGGTLDLTGAAIGGELNLSSGRMMHHPIWHDHAYLILRNARADALHAAAGSWRMSKGSRLLPTDLIGFTFNRFGGLDTSGSANMGYEEADWLIGWIEAQQDHGSGYDPQPYTQLARVLEAAGATDKAKAIRFAKFEHKRDYDKSMTTVRHFLLTIERYLFGYGLYPFRVIYWFVGLVALGWLLAQFSEQASVRRWMGLWYSLENALPLIETNERFKCGHHGRAWLRHFFHFQKACGFVLATVLVGALTLLSS